jgi:hypothetical protein
MKKIILGLSVLLALSLTMVGCAVSTDDSLDALARKAAANGIRWIGDEGFASTGELQDWVTTVYPFRSSKDNASGIKITSNSHSAAAPDMFFRWDNKQRDDGFLKIRTSFFEENIGFMLTKKVSNEYWDYPITLDGIKGTYTDATGEFYIFFIPKGKGYIEAGVTYNPLTRQQTQVQQFMPGPRGGCNKNINMVFINRAVPINPPPVPIHGETKSETRYTVTFAKEVVDFRGNPVALEDWIADRGLFTFTLVGYEPVQTAQPGLDGMVVFSGLTKAGPFTVTETITGEGASRYVAPGESFIVVDAVAQTRTLQLVSRANAATGGNVHLVDPGLQHRYYGPDIKTLWNNNIAAQNPSGFAAMSAFNPDWVWSQADSWKTGITGSVVIHYNTSFVIGEDEVLPASIPMYFAADNAAVLFINGERVAYTTAPFHLAGMAAPNAIEDSIDVTFNFPQVDAGQDTAWNILYFVDLAEHIKGAGRYDVVFVAANMDEFGGRYNLDNNPAGLIFGAEIVLGKDKGVVNSVFTNTLAARPISRSAISGYTVNTGVITWNSDNRARRGSNYFQMIPAGNSANSYDTYILLAPLANVGSSISIDVIDGNSGNGWWDLYGQLTLTRTGVDTLELSANREIAAGTGRFILYNLDCPQLAKHDNPESWTGRISGALPLTIPYAGQTYFYLTVAGVRFYLD